MVNYFLNGAISNSIKLQINSIPIIKSLFSEVNPIPVKSALNLIGFDFGVPRLPLTKFSYGKELILKKELEKIKTEFS